MSSPDRYGPAHRRQRAALRPQVEAGLVLCARCGERIEPGSDWDLGHVDGSAEYAGPEHQACNRATMTHAQQARTDHTSRVW
jgi:hypothetical protein